MPYDNSYSLGFQNRTRIYDVYFLDGYIHQKRQIVESWCGMGTNPRLSKIREVKFPVSKSILKEFNIPSGVRINAS